MNENRCALRADEILKPCPFCGEEGQLRMIDYGYLAGAQLVLYYVYCGSNCLTKSGSYTDREQAISHWNTRISELWHYDDTPDESSNYIATVVDKNGIRYTTCIIFDGGDGWHYRDGVKPEWIGHTIVAWTPFPIPAPRRTE